MASPNELEEWRAILVARGFQGNVANGALLMQAFVEGKSWMEEKFQRRGLRFLKPRIVLVDDLGRARYQHNLATRSLEVSIRKLEEDSLDDPCEVFDFLNPAGELTFVGNLQQFRAVGGLEEAAHCIRSQFRFTPKLPEGNQHLVSAAEYHSAPLEFDALNWKFRYSREKGLGKAEHLFDDVRRTARASYIVNKRAEQLLRELHRAARRKSLLELQGGTESAFEVA